MNQQTYSRALEDFRLLRRSYLPLSASSSVCMPVAERSASISLFLARESADTVGYFRMSHGVICASAPALSPGIIREATAVKFLPRSLRICESQTYYPHLAHHKGDHRERSH